MTPTPTPKKRDRPRIFQKEPEDCAWRIVGKVTARLCIAWVTPPYIWVFLNIKTPMIENVAASITTP